LYSIHQSFPLERIYICKNRIKRLQTNQKYVYTLYVCISYFWIESNDRIVLMHELWLEQKFIAWKLDVKIQDRVDHFSQETPRYESLLCAMFLLFFYFFFSLFSFGFFFIFFFVFHLLSFFSLAFSFVCLFVWFFSFLGNQVETLPIPTSWNRHIFTMGTFHQSPGLLLHLIPLNYWSVPSFGSTQSRCILGHISSIWFCFFFNDILSGFVNRSKRSVLY